ncbi:MAG TPA: phosphatidate cytidylyltransferase [Clostridia bacterium]|nr:phosphatidate cytidylyltransferase [Clostridia bacterium]
MLKRTIAGIIMTAVLFLVIFLTKYSQFIFDALLMIVCIVATYEMYGATRRADTKIEGRNGYNPSIVSLIVALIIIYPLSHFFGFIGLLFTAILSVLVAFMFFIFDSKKSFNDFTVNVFLLFYPLIFIGLLFVLGESYGMIPIMLAVGISTISDAFACWVGAAIGKRKMFPKISPKKTVAGFVGGIFGGGVGAIIVYLIFEMASFPTNIKFTFGGLVGDKVFITIIIYAVIGFIVALFSEIGDLAASRIKREVGIKDYGKILGSHGGVMDRIDSIMFTSVCIAVIMQIIELIVK